MSGEAAKPSINHVEFSHVQLFLYTVLMKQHIPLVTPFVVACLFLLGCGQKTPYSIVPIEGTVSYQGKPLPRSFVLEFRSDPQYRPSQGWIGDNGKFKAVHTPSITGCPVGPCTVHVRWGGSEGTKPPEGFDEMLENYGFESPGLPMEIKKKDLNFKIDFP